MKNYIYRVYFNLKDNNKTRMIIDVKYGTVIIITK